MHKNMKYMKYKHPYDIVQHCINHVQCKEQLLITKKVMSKALVCITNLT